MRGRLARHGVLAGFSAVVAVAAGAATNLATSGWSWPVGASLLVLTGAYVGLEVWRAARDEPSQVRGYRGAADREAPQRRSVVPPWGLLPAQVRGRDENLAELAAVSEAPDGKIHVLWGLGGCGKTTVALKAAEQAFDSNANVWWISARDKTSLTSGLIDMAVQLGASPDEVAQAKTGVHSLTDLVWRYLESASDRWMLVIDNADQPELLAAEGGRVRDGNGVVRGSTRGLVVVTSRVGGADVWGGRAVLHTVASLSQQDGARVLLDVAGGAAGSLDDAAALAQRLGGLPLALRAAGRYLASTAAYLDGITNFFSYRQTLEAQFVMLLGPNAVQVAEPRDAVMTTWELSLDLLAERGAVQARPIMRLIGGLAPAPIPITMLNVRLLDQSPLFTHHGVAARGQRAGAGLQRIRHRRGQRYYDDAMHRRALTGLTDFGLLDRTTPMLAPGGRAVDCLVAHPLVVETNAATVRDDADLRRVIDKTVAALLSATAGRLDPDDPVEAAWWPLLAPHVMLALGREGEDSRAQGSLVDAACAVSQGLRRAGDYLASHTLADAACRLARRRLKLDDPVMLSARYHLASAVNQLGDFEQSEAEYREVLKVQQRVLGSDHPDTLRTRHDLAWLQRQRGRYGDAVVEYREVFQARRRALGDEHPETLRSQRNLAAVLAFQHRHNEAEAEFRRVFDAQTRTLGADHPDTVRSRHDHAHALASQGRHTKAEAEYRAVLQVLSQLLGPEHIDTFRTRHDLAWAIALQGRYGEAETEYRVVLRALTHLLGPEHIDTFRTRHDLASVAALQGRFEEAETEFPAVLAARQRILGPEHPATLRTLRNLAWLAARQGHYAQAEAQYRAVLETQRRTLGPDDPDTQLTDAHLHDLPNWRAPNATRPPLWPKAVAPSLKLPAASE